MKLSPAKLNGSLILTVLFVLTSLLYAEGGLDSRKSLNKNAGYITPPYTYMNINNISTLIYADGTADNSLLGNSGFFYPKESRKAAVYMSGFVWAGKVKGEVRANGSTFMSGLRPGKILPGGVPEDPSNVRIYRVRRNYKTADLYSEISDNEGTESEIRERYDKDWKEWPAADGAPYEDVNKDGRYDPSIDIPGEPGAEETIWFVANDLDETTSRSFLGSNPIGIEMQCTVYAFVGPGPVKNTIFKKYKLINKSNSSIDSMYTMTWGDMDLGDAQDDFAGCDTLLSLGYNYNANTVDAMYEDTPPSVGLALLQGPLVKGLASDTAYLNNRKLPGKKNLPMTSVGYVFKLSNEFGGDLGLGGNYKNGTLRLYNYIQGKTITGRYFPIPAALGGGETRFPFSGDPAAKTGYLDGTIYPVADRRIGVNSGPFTMAPGDTQEVVFAQIAAGAAPGVSNLEAVALLKKSTLFVREFFDAGRKELHTLSSPFLTAGEYDKEIVLNWGNDQDLVRKIESFDFLTLKFEGYNLYQLPFAGVRISEGKRIAVFDIADSIKIVYGDVVNRETGAIERLAQQFGKNSGVQRYLRIKEDAYTNLPLINGKKYYFAVTAYYVSPNLDPTNMESLPSYVEAVPQSNDPGVVYGSAFGDTLKAEHISGSGEGEIIPIVMDPKMLTGDEYRVEFESTNSFPAMKVVDVTKNKTVLSNVPVSSENNMYVYADASSSADGILFKVISPAPGVKPDDQYSDSDTSDWGWKVISGTRRFTWSGAIGLGLEGFRGAIGAGATWLGSSVGYDKTKNILIRLAAVDTSGNVNPNDQNVSYAYRYLRWADKAPAKPEFAQFIINPGQPGDYAYQDFKKNFPFAAYDIEDPQHPRRLAVGYLENNASGGLVDGKYWPPASGINNIDVNSPREWFFIFDTGYEEKEDPVLKGSPIGGKMPVLIHATVNRISSSWPGGDELGIYVRHTFTPQDVFTFRSKAPQFDGQSAKADVNRINVFPNPYYGVNSQELNRYERFVTFSHLPRKATIRIFNLAGQLIRTIRKDSPGQFAKWDLLNEHNFQTASGIYLVHIDMPDLGKTKILKLAVIQEQIVPERY